MNISRAKYENALADAFEQGKALAESELTALRAEVTRLRGELDEERNLACETPPPDCDCPGCSYAREQRDTEEKP